MVQVIPRLDVGGQIGQAIGRGLGSAAEDYSKRSMLREGLQNISQMGADTKPMDILSNLLTIPGMTDQRAQMLYPFVRDQIIQNQAGAREEGDAGDVVQDIPESPKNAVTGALNDQQFQDLYGIDPASITTSEDLQTARALRPVGGPEEIQKRAYKFMGDPKYALTHQTFEDFQKLAEQSIAKDQANFDARLSRQERNLNIENDVRNQTRARMGELLKGDPMQVLPEDVFTRLEQDALNMVKADNVPVTQAAQEVAKRANNFSRSRNQLKTEGSASFLGSSDKLMNQLRNYRKTYAEVGALETYVDDLQNLNGMTEHMARSFAYPLSSGVEVAIKKIPEFKESKLQKGVSQVGLLLGVPLGLIDEAARNPKLNQKIMKASNDFTQNIIGALKPDDSLHSILMSASQKGLNEDSIIKQMKEARNNNQLSLTEIQNRELDTLEPLDWSMGDYFTTAMSALPGMGKSKYTIPELIRRKLGKGR